MPRKIQRAESRLLAAWSKRGALAILLLPLAAVFFCLSVIRRWAYSFGILGIADLPVPVVIVGNLTVGGVGKTPLVISLVEQLKQRGYRPGVITRGYGGKGEGGEVPLAGDPEQFGDEPVLIRMRTACPVVVGRDRVGAARQMLQIAPETNVIISDDGLQHYALPRQVEIVVIDDRGFMNGWLLPAGPMRETARRLLTVDAIVGNGVSVPPFDSAEVPFFQMTMKAGEFYALQDIGRRVTSTNLRDTLSPSPSVPLPQGAREGIGASGAGSDGRITSTNWQGLKLHGVAGIGSPNRFFKQLAQLDIVSINHPFPDHHAYTADELDFDGDAILTTEKDAVKLRRLTLRLPVWVMPIDACVQPNLADFVVKKLVEKNRGFPSA